jgi:DNA translocase FtsK/SpoIIIE-like protein
MPSVTKPSRSWTERARYDWRSRALQVLNSQVRMAPRWGGSLLDYIHVPPEDWTDRPDLFPGARKVVITWPPGRLFRPKLWARIWNQAFGFPLYGPPWTWTYRPDLGALFGEPFDLQGDDQGRLWLPYEQIDYAGHPRQIVCGLCEDGTTLVHDLDTTPHAMAAGATGAGKTKALHTRLFHLLAADVVSGLVVLDWKRTDFKVFQGRAWDPQRCRGVTVAKPDLDVAGGLDSLSTMVAVCESAYAELGRRMLANEDTDEGEDPWADELVLLVFDEVLATLQREANPPKDDKSDQAELVRNRNRQRTRIEFILGQVVILGRALHVHAILGASSPRAEFLTGEAKAAVQHRVYLGQFQDVSEPVIVFGKDAPESPPPWPGYGVWRVLRPDADPAEPYLYFKAFWVPASWLDIMLDNRVMSATDRAAALALADDPETAEVSPWLRDAT